MLGVGLRQLCLLGSFGHAFRKKKTVRKSTHGGCKTGPRGVQNGLPDASGRVLCQLGPTWPWGRSWDLLGRPGPLLGACVGSFWDPPKLI